MWETKTEIVIWSRNKNPDFPYQSLESKLFGQREMKSMHSLFPLFSLMNIYNFQQKRTVFMQTNKKGLSQDTAHLGHCQAETGVDSDETQGCFFLTVFELQEEKQGASSKCSFGVLGSSLPQERCWGFQRDEALGTRHQKSTHPSWNSSRAWWCSALGALLGTLQAQLQRQHLGYSSVRQINRIWRILSLVGNILKHQYLPFLSLHPLCSLICELRIISFFVQRCECFNVFIQQFIFSLEKSR